jgi:uncharacterized protein YjeT (DUF2065 family)
VTEPTPLWNILFAALALMLVVEGLLPFLSPRSWRSVFERATRMTDGQIRFLGLTSMIAGVAMLLLFWP